MNELMITADELSQFGWCEVRWHVVAAAAAFLPYLFFVWLCAHAPAKRRPMPRHTTLLLAAWGYLVGFAFPLLYDSQSNYGCIVDMTGITLAWIAAPLLVMLRAWLACRCTLLQILPFLPGMVIADFLAQLVFYAVAELPVCR